MLKRTAAFFLSISLCLLQTNTFATADPAPQQGGTAPSEAGLPTASEVQEYAPGRLIVKLKEGATAGDLEEVKRAVQAEEARELYPKVPSPEERLKALKGERVRLDAPEHSEWYWWKDKESAEYKDYQARLGKEKKALDERIQAQEELIERLEARQARAPVEAVAPSLEGTYILKVDEKADIPALALKLSQDPRVEYAQPDYIYQIQMIPDDPYYASSGSWGQPYDDLWGLKKMTMETAWDLSQGEGILVAVIDTGVEYTHPDLAANIWINAGEIADNGVDDDANGYVDDVRGWDFVNNDADPKDDHVHGTHAAGTIAAVGNNQRGLIGVAPKSRILPLKSASDQGFLFSSAIAAAIRYAVNQGADVINNSYGGPGFTDPAVTAAMLDALEKGILPVAAAGNDNRDVRFVGPANIPGVLAVAAATHRDEKASFSNFGAKVDVAAPGGGYLREFRDDADIHNILSAVPEDGGYVQDNPGLVVSSGYLRLSGTSMASPHVAGLAALLLARTPEAPLEEIVARITATTDPFAIEPAVPLGTGRVNAYAALTGSPGPFFRVVDAKLEDTDGDRLPGSGDEVLLTVTLKNIWPGTQAASVRGTLTSGNPYILQIHKPGADFGSVAGGEVKSNAADPFRFRIARLDPGERIVYFKLLLQADGQTQTQGLTFPVTLGVRFLPNRPVIVNDRLDFSGTSDGTSAWIVWEDGRNRDPNTAPYNTDIYRYDLKTDQEVRMTDHAAEQGSPAIEAGRIVWRDLRSGLPRVYSAELLLFGGEGAISSAQARPIEPAISGPNVVWADTGTDDLTFYSMSSGLESAFPQPASQRVPSVSGRSLIWLDNRHSAEGVYRDIYFYDFLAPALGARRATPDNAVLFDAAGNFGGAPTVRGRWIVWADKRSGNWDIYLYDLGTGTEQAVLSGSGNQFQPAVHGNRIVCLAEGAPDHWDVFLADLEAGKLWRVTEPTGILQDQRGPKIFGDRVVWVDTRNGFQQIVVGEIPVSNYAPVLEAIPNHSVREGRNLTFTLSAVDPDRDALTYSVKLAPAGAIFNPTSGKFSWTPGFEQAGSYPLTISVTDGKLSDQKSMTVTVENDTTYDRSITTRKGRPVRLGLGPVRDTDGQKLEYVRKNLPVRGNVGLLGDVTGEGILTNADATTIGYYVARTRAPTPLQRFLADVNGSGTLTSADVTWVGQLVSGQAESFPSVPGRVGVGYVPKTATFVGRDRFTYWVKKGNQTVGLATISVTITR